MKHFKKINQLLRSLAMLLCIVLLLPILPVLPGSAEDPSLAAEGSAEGEVTVVCEDESKRTAFEKHYLLSDGTYYAVSYAEAVHEQDEQGKWVDAHSAPVYDEDEDAYLVKGKGYRASFGLSQNKAALINKKGQALCWHYELIGYEDEKAVMKLEKKNAKAQGGKNASPKGKKVGDKDAFALPEAQGELLFEDAFSALGAEVRYTVSPQKIKEDVILNEKGRVYALSMVIENCSYKARLEDGAVIFEDNKGNDYFYVDAPLMYDAAGESSTAVQVLLKQTGKTVTVTYTPDKAWLDAPERVYPVTFDPAVTTGDYASNMEDGQLLLAKGSVCNTTNNRMAVGKAGGVEARGVIYIETLPHTGNLPIIQASLHLPTYSSASSSVAGNTLILEEISYTGALNELTSDTTVTPVSQVGTAAIAQGDTSFTFNVLTASLLEKRTAGQSICYRLRLQTVPSSGALNLGTKEQSNASKKPVLTVCYGYQNPSFVGEQIFLNNNYTSSASRQQLVANGSILSMANFIPNNAAASMVLEESSNGVRIKSLYNDYYLDAANGENGCPASGSSVSGNTTGDEWIVLQMSSARFLILLRSNPTLALTRGNSGIVLSTVNSDDTNNQYWIISDTNDLFKNDGIVLESGIYYINNLSSRTFMVLNTPTATTPILKAGTEAALGDKMAWKFTYIGNGYYTIESVLRPWYYLTCSSAGVAVEFLSGYETVPSKAKFTAVRTSDGYAFKSGTNHYLSKSSSSSTALSTATSASTERARWRVCLNNNYVQFEELDCRVPIFVGESTPLSMFNQHTWDTIDDFTSFTVSSTTVTLNGTTVTCNAAGTVTLNSTHIPTGTTCSIELFTPSIDMKNSNTAINNTLNRTKVLEYIRLYCNDGTQSTTSNSEYVEFGGNCANFVSQCLHYGGMPFSGNPTNYGDALLSYKDTDKWYYNDNYGTSTTGGDRSGISYTWSAADNFRKYWGLRNSTTIGNCYRYVQYDTGNDLLDALPYWKNKLDTGDVIQYFDANGVAEHTMIVNRTSDDSVFLSYNTSNNYDVSLESIMERYGSRSFCIIQIAQ